ncbi:hypothetical protein MNV49_001981 [Pseudohyphozyma bogoriensis]|nr:hypothetical protein MNV49_001981 [Pseudohyphozyma bogoriensis]
MSTKPSLLASTISSLVTGQYDFLALPILLPTPLISALLSSTPYSSATPSPPPSLPASETPEGFSWVVLEAGKQIGMGVPGSRSDFFEAKLEIPLTTNDSTPKHFVYKHTLLFSSRSMALSSSYITGLRSHRTGFTVTESSGNSKGVYEATGWLRSEDRGVGEVGGWTEEVMRTVLGGWWVGEKTGGTATRFIFTAVSPPTPVFQTVSLHLPSFLRLSHDDTKALVSNPKTGSLVVDAEGWLEVNVVGWRLSEKSRMEVAGVGAC